MLCVQKCLKFQMPYLAVADNLHPMYQHSGEALKVQKLRIQPYYLHLCSPIAFAVLDTATVRGNNPNIFYVILQNIIDVLGSIFAQCEWSIEEQGGNIIPDASHRLGVSDAMNKGMFRPLPRCLQMSSIGRIFHAQIVISSFHNSLAFSSSSAKCYRYCACNQR